MKKGIFVLLLVLMSSCGASIAVDYDTEKEFGGYKTYNFYPVISSGLTQIDNTRVEVVADSLMTLQGFTKSDIPDLYINYYASEIVTQSQNTLGVGIGGGGRNGSVGVSGGIPIGGNVVKQLFTLDIIDVKEDALIWQAKAKGDYKEAASPEKKDDYYFKILKSILIQFPPKKTNQ